MYRRVIIVLVQIKHKPVLFVNHACDIVDFALVVKDGVTLQRQIRSVPSVGVVDGRSDDVDPKDKRG